MGNKYGESLPIHLLASPGPESEVFLMYIGMLVIVDYDSLQEDLFFEKPNLVQLNLYMAYSEQ